MSDQSLLEKVSTSYIIEHNNSNTTLSTTLSTTIKSTHSTNHLNHQNNHDNQHTLHKTNYVLVIDTNKRPLAPCKPGMARCLLTSGKAAIFRRYPFTIILNKEVKGDTPKCQLKIDPGSKTTGLALVQEDKVIWAAELTNRGHLISERLRARALIRRSRRYRKTSS